MNHLTEVELVEHYYGRNTAEGSSPAAARHVKECGACARAFSTLQAELAEVAVPDPPARDAAYGERVWQSIAPSLQAYEKRSHGWMRMGLWSGLAYSVACALMAVGAFFAGRLWEQRQPHNAVVVQPKTPEVKQRVVVVVLSDHLDRSERLLVQLKHADVDNTELAKPLREEARSLLAANHICREKAEGVKDPELTTALDHLDQLLSKLADQPGGLNAAALAELQREMKSEHLLFEVRVLRSRVPAGQAGHGTGSKGGTA